MNRITPSLVRAWHARGLRLGVGRSSLAGSYALLRAICNTAVRDEVLLRNPCMIRGAGSQRPAERQVVSLGQLDELVALSWDRLDLAAGRMTIDRQLVELTTGAVRLHLDTPKTAAGRRTVHLPPHLLRRRCLPFRHRRCAPGGRRVPCGRSLARARFGST